MAEPLDVAHHPVPRSAGEAASVEVDVIRYAARIEYDGPLVPDAAVLRDLQLAHMCTVPFENLDVVARLPVETTVQWSYPKIVDRNRGGWCFEINGAFGALLETIGFPVTYHSARVWDALRRELGPPLDHLCLIVEADGERWLVDAGFGDSSVAPVAIGPGVEQAGFPRRCRVTSAEQGFAYEEFMPRRLSRVRDDWEVQYVVDPAPRALAEFQPRSDALAAGDGQGYFTEKPFATRALGAGGDRVWLLKDRLKIRRGDGHAIPVEEPVTDDEWPGTLREWFGFGVDLAGGSGPLPGALRDRTGQPGLGVVPPSGG